MASAGDLLVRARDALAATAGKNEKKATEAALRLVLEAWRQKRAPEIADLVDRLSTRIRRPALGKANLEKMQARFLEIAAPRDPADVPRLLAALTNGSTQQLPKRMSEIAAFEDDPRIAIALADLIAVPPIADSASARKAFQIARDVVVRTHDVRVLPRLAPHGGRPEAASLARELEARLKPSAPLTAEETAVIEDIRKRTQGAVSEADLLAAIYAAPEDDGPREVYADWLLENGQAKRGELITLQLRRARKGETGSSARERILLIDKHQWTGPIGKVADVVAFERGFPAQCSAQAKNQRTFVSALSHPAWATVKSLSIDGFPTVPPSFLALPGFRHLEEVSGLEVEFASTAARAPTPHQHLRSVGIREKLETPTPVALRKALGIDWVGLPRVRELSLGFPVLPSPEHVEALMAGSLAHQLETLFLSGDEIAEGAGSITAWLAPLTPTKVRELTLYVGKAMTRVREPGSIEWREP